MGWFLQLHRYWDSQPFYFEINGQVLRAVENNVIDPHDLLLLLLYLVHVVIT